MHIYFDNYIIGILDSKYQNLTTFKTNPFSIFYICKLPREQLKLILKLKRSNCGEVWGKLIENSSFIININNRLQCNAGT